MTRTQLDTRAYWEQRLSVRIDLRGTGHRAFGLHYNQWLYQAQHDCVSALLRDYKIALTRKSVLDVGSGTGYFVDLFTRQGAQSVTGIDIAEASTHYLRQRYPQHTFLTGDISANNLPVDHSFDLVSAFGVLYHIVDDDRFGQALRNLCQCTAPSGYLFVSDTFHRPWLPTASHARCRPLSDYASILDRLDMRILRIIPVYYFLNRTFVPVVGPRVIQTCGLGRVFYTADRQLRRWGAPNGDGMKLMLTRRES